MLLIQQEVSHKICECSTLAQKLAYKNRHDWVRMVINLELCKQLGFGHANKWYMHQEKADLANRENKIVF